MTVCYFKKKFVFFNYKVFIKFLTPKVKWGDCGSLHFWNCTHWIQHESVDPIPYREDNHGGAAVQGVTRPHQLPPTLQGVLLCSGTVIFLQSQGRSLIYSKLRKLIIPRFNKQALMLLFNKIHKHQYLWIHFPGWVNFQAMVILRISFVTVCF